LIKFKGEWVEIQSLSNQYDIPYSTINNRYKAGIRDEGLIVRRIKPIIHDGVETTLLELSKKYGIVYSTLRSRHAAGVPDSELVKDEHLGTGIEKNASKLNVEKVREIKVLLAEKALKQREIAVLFSIT
jgi:hypothetical protein